MSFTAAAGASITRADWAFGNGATANTNNGDVGYAFPAPGTFVVRVIVTVADGRTGTASQSVTVRRKTPPPAPAPTPGPPPPNTSGFGTSIACAAKPTGSATPCQAAVTYNGKPQPSASITQVQWDFGDGETATIAGPVTSHTYWGAGSYTVFATVTATRPGPPEGPGTPDTQRVSTVITIP